MIELKQFKKQYNFQFKIILLGITDCGKSSYLSRLVYNTFNLMKNESVGIEVGTLSFKNNKYNYQFDIWDGFGGSDGYSKSSLFIENSFGIS